MIAIDGYDINYKITGNGPETVVILQGWGTTLEVYDSIARVLAPAYRVVQLDLPGFGGSSEPREPWDVSAYCRFFETFMSALDIKKAHLIGHSYGGRMIIRLAAEGCSFEIGKILLVDAAGIVPKKSFATRAKIRVFKIGKWILMRPFVYGLIPETVDGWLSQQGSADYRSATPMMRQCLVRAVNEDLSHLLPNIKNETLMVWGTADTATPLADGKLMEEKIPDAALVTIEGAGHYSFLEQPQLFAGLLRSYFQIEG